MSKNEKSILIYCQDARQVTRRVVSSSKYTQKELQDMIGGAPIIILEKSYQVQSVDEDEDAVRVYVQIISVARI